MTNVKLKKEALKKEKEVLVRTMYETNTRDYFKTYVSK